MAKKKKTSNKKQQHNHKPKHQTQAKTQNRTKVKKQSSNVKDNKLFKTYPEERLKLQNLVILLVAFAISIVMVNRTIDDLADYIPISDEVNIIYKINGIYETGRTNEIFPLGSARRDTTLALTKENYWRNGEYQLESYMRFPFYYFSEDKFDFSWAGLSNSFYLYLIFAGVLLSVLFFKETKIPIVTVAVLAILIGYSYWASASFHYIRYYCYMFLAIIVSHFACTYLHTISNIKYIFKRLFTILIALIPGFFHPAGYILSFYWIAMVGIDELKQMRSGFNRKKLISSVVVLLGVGFAFFYNWGKINLALSKLNFDSFGTIAEKFIQLNFPTKPFSVFILLIIVVLGGISYKKWSVFEKKLLLHSVVFLFAGFVLASLIMGSNYSSFHGANRYYFFLHGIYLIILALFISAIHKNIKEKIKPFYLKILPVFILLLPLFTGHFDINGQNQEVYNFSILPRIKKADLQQMENNLTKNNQDFVIISSNPSLAWSAFPKKPYLHTSSNLNDYCEFLTKNNDKTVFFWAADFSKAKKDVLDKFKQIKGFTGQGGSIPAKFLTGLFCKKNEK